MNEKELTFQMEALAGLMQVLRDQELVFEEQTAKLRALIDEKKEVLKAEFLTRKESFKTDHLIVKYRKGAVRWDSTGLKIYAKTHPELNEFQKVGEPTVAFSLPKEEDEDKSLMTMEER